MRPRQLDCLAEAADGTVHVLRPSQVAGFLAGLPPTASALMAAAGFTGEPGQPPVLFPTADGIDAVIGIGQDRSPYAFGALATALPARAWRLAPGDYDPDAAVLGFCLGAYAYDQFRAPVRPLARLTLPAGSDARTAFLAETIWFARDLVNAPANVLGPAELAAAMRHVAEAADADFTLVEGATLAEAYPAVHAVGAGAARPPAVGVLRWHGSGALPGAPLLSLCGKGVVFDTGGLDLKPSSAMLRMKKDMGGAALMLGLARCLMQQDLPIRLELRLGCVENAISGSAMRPGDVLRTRAGRTIEIGNTDAEGRLVLCDLLTEACEESPTLLLDCATLTGAARVALGPDLPALFSNDDAVASALLEAGQSVADPLWRLPLWPGYDEWLKSPIADLNNVSSKPHAGAITAALFLQRFVTPGTRWAHIDAYAWNEQTRPGRPEGGEAMGLRALLAAIPRLMRSQA